MMKKVESERTSGPRGAKRDALTAGRLSLVAFILATALCLLSNACQAHPVSVTRALVYLTREQASAKVEVFLEDLFLFHNLKPNDADFLDAAVIRRGIELHKKFVAERFEIHDVEGRPLTPNGSPTVKADIPDEGVPLSELMAHRLTFELNYPVDAPPEFLTFKQRFTDEDALLPSEMRLHVQQENAETIDKTLTPDEPFSVRFSWSNPPLSAEASEEARKRWAERQQEETLGITSYSSVYSFLYIEDHEIRHEILIPLLTLEQSVLIARDDDDLLDIAEQDTAIPQIEAYFSTGNPILVGGERLEPVMQRCDFFGLDFRDFAKQAKRKTVSIASARVGVILSYPLDSAPRDLQLTWDRFNDSVWAVNMVVVAQGDAARAKLTRAAGQNVFEWTSDGRPPPPPLQRVPVAVSPVKANGLPLISIGCLLAIPVVAFGMLRGGASGKLVGLTITLLILTAALTWRVTLGTRTPGAVATRGDEDSDAIFARVHANIYGAFHRAGESEVYDALAISVDGSLLRDVYLQIQRGLKMQEQGGAVSRIRAVEIVDGDRQPLTGEPGFGYRCRWNVAGAVEHWGHIHQRTNQYEAVFTLKPIEGVWKVTEMELLDEQRLQFDTKLRKL